MLPPARISRLREPRGCGLVLRDVGGVQKDGRAATRCARTRKRRLRRSAAERRRVAESSFFEREWQRAYWGPNYPKLLEIKKKYDPTGLFFVHNSVGSEEWSADGFTRLAGP
jgi:hypothetical protein